MGVTATFSIDSVRRRLRQTQRQINETTLNMLRLLGEQCVAVARTNGNYRDQTGNLRASVGYIVVRMGINRRIVVDSFSDSDGGRAGQRLARRLRNQLPQGVSGWALIVVAGMSYAAKVESRGRDVLTSAEQYAIANLPSLLRDLEKTTNRLAAR